ncbi:MAG: ATPase domain-containing protein [Candidatus Bathyarchaeia archaeon]
MRLPILILTLLILIPFLPVPQAQAQTNPQYVILYAHGYGSSATLTALPQFNTQKAADLTNGMDFKLSPVLGQDLQIQGPLTFNLYVRASGPFEGTVGAQLAEVTPGGLQTLVPGARVDTLIFLNTAMIPVTLGVGPAITYKFHAGSTILFHIGIAQTSGTGRPLLVWDDASAPTSVKIPTIDPANAEIKYFGERNFGRIFEAGANGTQSIRVNATLTDAIGVYRFSSAALRLTEENGSSISLPLNPKNTTDYSTTYAVASHFGEGQWQASLLLHDSSGNDYSFSQPFWVTQFYPVSIVVLASDGSSLSNATLTVGFDAESFWRSVTNASGWGALSLPSTQVVGPLNLTVSWLGTQSLFPLEVNNATTVTLQLTVYSPSIRVTLLNIPVPFVNVSLYQISEVQHVSTGLDGTAKFRSIPAGNYIAHVDYLLTSYQASLHVGQNGVTIIPVPFPHRTITTTASIAIIALASVVLIRRKRGKLYPTNFNYFSQLTHGGLPEACFVVIAGNSGSGKTVLLNCLAAEHLASGSSIYITNTEYPDKIRDSMMRLGVGNAPDVKDPTHLMFIDAYSAVGGGSSMEEFSVNSHTDLTNLGLSISKCLQVAGNGADIYMDSLNPLITALRIDYVINFLQTVAARVKANNGKLCITVGAGIDDRDMTKLEESADCVIETQLNESGAGQRRRLRIKKLRGKAYNDRWTQFRVEENTGIVFLTRTKPTNPPELAI